MIRRSNVPRGRSLPKAVRPHRAAFPPSRRPAEKRTGGNYSGSHGEKTLAWHLDGYHIRYVREFRPWAQRRYRFDFRLTDTRVLVEVQGGIWSKGGHSTGGGITRDCEKFSLAAADGWRVVPVTTEQIRTGAAIQWIIAAWNWKET